jgi:hypothetical protein
MRIPVLTYHALSGSGNEYGSNDHVAFEKDLSIIEQLGGNIIGLEVIANCVAAAILAARAIVLRQESGVRATARLATASAIHPIAIPRMQRTALTTGIPRISKALMEPCGCRNTSLNRSASAAIAKQAPSTAGIADRKLRSATIQNT